MHKKCPRCGETKPSTEYYVNNARKDGLSGYCKTCQKELMNAVYRKNYAPKRKVKDREYYLAHKEKSLENRHKYLKSRLELLWSIKTPCVKCGEERKCAIQFHHINPNDKTVSLSHGSIGKARILEESKKCVCLCANCHAEFHYLYGHKPDNPEEALDLYLRGE